MDALRGSFISSIAKLPASSSRFFLMSLCRRAHKLATSDGVTHFLLKDYCVAHLRLALRVQQGNWAWVPREEVRHVYTSTRSEYPDSMGRAELSPIRQSRISKHPGKAGPGATARTLLQKLTGLSDVKEDVFGALDEWAAFEFKFPIVATRKALERLRKEEQWHRVIQVTKWMFSKGLGKTHGSYGLLLKAYYRNGRLDEAEELWNSLISMNDRSMPKILFGFMTSAYRKQEMPEKVIKHGKNYLLPHFLFLSLYACERDEGSA
ncbi:hypothetical protein GOP47_0017901 [Adiantum capillus-veneris]|uniref:Pentatricopeptide repeat-containing protein n=1 Tax=Adiantum capillus-veneris TaxID=13818 RepID=A0A9D4Z9M9_ADICA|nr:hypothetical protein GOP47_0017901 [Adiantum capillus-veneris]